MPESRIHAIEAEQPAAQAGAAMDRPVKRRFPRLALPALAGAVVIGMVSVSYASLRSGPHSVVRVDEGTVRTARVSLGTFEDFIPIRAEVRPASSVYLATLVGGRVEKVWAEAGALLQAGDTIVTLVNPTVRAGVVDAELAATREINALRALELASETARLEHEKRMIALDHEIQRLERRVGIWQGLVAEGAASALDLQELEDSLVFQKQLRRAEAEAWKRGEVLREAQAAQNAESVDALERSLAIARGNLASLSVTAPVAGRLSGIDVAAGQSVSAGERLGQIDAVESFSLRAKLDEFYLDRVAPGHGATAMIDGAEAELRVDKVFPEVADGRFEVSLSFVSGDIGDMRRGQTIAARLMLGDPEPAMLLSAGDFLESSGGRWVYVVTEDGTAQRRDVTLGRRNAQVVEVVSGLTAGDRVIVSTYDAYGDAERIRLQG